MLTLWAIYKSGTIIRLRFRQNAGLIFMGSLNAILYCLCFCKNEMSNTGTFFELIVAQTVAYNCMVFTFMDYL